LLFVEVEFVGEEAERTPNTEGAVFVVPCRKMSARAATAARMTHRFRRAAMAARPPHDMGMH
jgi:hypothetical protein